MQHCAFDAWSVSDWKLDPQRFPRRIDLEVSEAVLQRLQQISLRTGRSISEVASGLVSQGVDQLPPKDQPASDP
jgi:hypothetical protein